MAKQPQYWLVKTEPDTYSIHHLAKEPKQTTYWDGVRNYQARNLIRDEMKKNDRVLFYHSSTKPTEIVGITKVVREAYPDFTAWDPKNAHFDPDSRPDNPRWYMVDLQLETIFDHPLTLDALRQVPELKGMELLRRGSRLSVQRVTKPEFQCILKLAGAK